jgi:hypothetical protein
MSAWLIGLNIFSKSSPNPLMCFDFERRVSRITVSHVRLEKRASTDEYNGVFFSIEDADLDTMDCNVKILSNNSVLYGRMLIFPDF